MAYLPYQHDVPCIQMLWPAIAGLKHRVPTKSCVFWYVGLHL